MRRPPIPFFLAAAALAWTLLLPTAALAARGAGTPFPACDDTCPLGMVCANVSGSCGCQLPTSSCQALTNPNGPPACYGACPPSQPICATLAGGCACIPTLSEWGVIALALLMLASVLTRGRAAPARPGG